MIDNKIIRAIICVAVFTAIFMTSFFALTRTPEALEKFDLEDLVFFTGLGGTKDLKWMSVLDKEGYLHRISKGSYIGKNYGLLEELREDHFVIRETYLIDDKYLPKRRIFKPSSINKIYYVECTETPCNTLPKNAYEMMPTSAK